MFPVNGAAVMDRLVLLLRKPGSKDAVEGVAPTQRTQSEGGNAENVAVDVTASKRTVLDRWLDRIVRASGSKFVFFAILAGLLTWALLGIPYGRTDSWQVIISDVQTIVCYVFDSFLVRQQLNEYENGMKAVAQLQSRLLSHARMLGVVEMGMQQEGRVEEISEKRVAVNIEELETALPEDTKFGRAISWCARVVGHGVTAILFWVAVFIWIGVGTLCNWSDKWQLYMNSASSALMVLIFFFLANIHERHSAYMKNCLDSIFSADSMLELELRCLTNDNLDNQTVIIPPPKVNWVQRAIFYYADFVGTLVGIAILLTVVAAWIAVGPILGFNANWWLLIGTYAGLIGMNDAFVLRNMQACLGGYVDGEYEKINEEDERLFKLFGLEIPPNKKPTGESLTSRVSQLSACLSACRS